MTPAHDGPKFGLLVVDDNRDAADSLALMLRAAGFDAHPTYGGAAAWDDIREHRPDCVISDINMPGVDGCELARRVRTEFAGVKLIAVSGRDDDEQVRRIREAGFDHQFTKPADPADLLEVLGMMERIKELAEQTQSLAGETRQLLTDVKEEVREVKMEVKELKQEVRELKQEVKDQRPEDGRPPAALSGG